MSKHSGGFSLRYNKQTGQWDVIEHTEPSRAPDSTGSAWIYGDSVAMGIIDRAIEHMTEFPTVEKILSQVVDKPTR